MCYIYIIVVLRETQHFLRGENMKYLLAIGNFFLIFLLCSCTPDQNSGKTKIAAGVPPIAGLASAIGGERMEIISILPSGRTPHDFTPNTATVRQAAGAALFLSAGMPFENKITDFLAGQNKDVCDISDGITRIEFHDGGTDAHHHHDGCSHDNHDPHIWLSPQNAVKISENICAAFCRIDPAGTEYYRKNLEIVKNELLATHQDIENRLAPFKGKVFFVYHPAFGYFADAYGLKQRAIELNGREARADQLAQITREAKNAGVKVIFVQEQFNPGSATALAKQIGGTVKPLDPLSGDLIGNFKEIANALEKGFKSEIE